MAARTPRLRFATPFVITMAAALPAAALGTACVAESQPAQRNPPYPHDNPPGPNEPVASTGTPPVNPDSTNPGHAGHAGHEGHAGHSNPPPRNPGPTTSPTTPTTPTTPTMPTTPRNPGTGVPPRNPGTTPTPVTPSNPPPPQPQPPITQGPTPLAFDQKWTVRRNGDKCLAVRDASCPKPEKGKPIATCNPPPPVDYACPTGLLDGKSVLIVQAANARECRIPAHDANACPPNAKCALPRPGVVPCPTR